MRSLKGLFRVLILVCVVSFPFGFATQVYSASINLGIMGDSGSDEYRADDNRGGNYRANTFVWDELLVRFRGVNLGTWSDTSRGEPRRRGYEYNWARSAATTSSLLSRGQHTGLAQQIREGKIDTVFLMIGVNDFAFGDGMFEPIYSGTLSGSALTTRLNQMRDNITQAADTVLAASQESNHPIVLIIGSVTDRALTPRALSSYPNATGRAKVSAAVAAVNTSVKNYAQSKNAIFIDQNAQLNTILSQLEGGRYLVKCGERLDYLSIGDEPHHLVLGDNEHAGTVGNIIFSNMLIEAINQRKPGTLTPFTDWEMLTYSGITPSQTAVCPGRPGSVSKPGDMDSDNDVDFNDFNLFKSSYGQSSGKADFNTNGIVDIFDYNILVANFGK